MVQKFLFLSFHFNGTGIWGGKTMYQCILTLDLKGCICHFVKPKGLHYTLSYPRARYGSMLLDLGLLRILSILSRPRPMVIVNIS